MKEMLLANGCFASSYIWLNFKKIALPAFRFSELQFVTILWLYIKSGNSSELRSKLSQQ